MKHIKLFEDLSIDEKFLKELREPWCADYVKLEKLLKDGANTNVKITLDNGRFFTPLISAANKNDSNIVLLLLKYGAEIDGQDSEGDTALLCVSKSERNLFTVCTLIEAGANLYIKNNNGDTIFDELDNYSKRVVLTKYPKKCEEYIISKKAKKYNL